MSPIRGYVHAPQVGASILSKENKGQHSAIRAPFARRAVSNRLRRKDLATGSYRGTGADMRVFGLAGVLGAALLTAPAFAAGVVMPMAPAAVAVEPAGRHAEVAAFDLRRSPG